jgi:hypothetical protein
MLISHVSKTVLTDVAESYVSRIAFVICAWPAARRLCQRNLTHMAYPSFPPRTAPSTFDQGSFANINRLCISAHNLSPGI